MFSFVLTFTKLRIDQVFVFADVFAKKMFNDFIIWDGLSHSL